MKQRLSFLVLSLLVLFFAFAFVTLSAIDPVQAQNVACYREQGGAKQVAASGCEYEMRSGSTLDVQSGATVTFGGDMTLQGIVTITDTLIVSPQSSLTVTDGGTITATGSYQPLTAAGAVGAALSTTCTAGTLTTFVNTANQTITITDTGNVVLSGNAALGQYDTLTVLCDGTRQIEIAQTDN